MDRVGVLISPAWDFILTAVFFFWFGWLAGRRTEENRQIQRDRENLIARHEKTLPPGGGR